MVKIGRKKNKGNNLEDRVAELEEQVDALCEYFDIETIKKTTVIKKSFGFTPKEKDK